MKIKLLLAISFLLMTGFRVASAQSYADSTNTKKWYSPEGLTLQFAGNIGMLSFGPRYDFNHEKYSAELLYGFVPKLDAEEMLHILTLRGRYKPFKKIPISNHTTLTPLRTGLALSYYFRDQFPTTWDSSYPTKDYYWWTSSMRITGGLGSEVNRKLDNAGFIKNIGLYGEVGTYDLIVTSAFKDKTLTTWDILSFSIGVSAGL